MPLRRRPIPRSTKSPRRCAGCRDGSGRARSGDSRKGRGPERRGDRRRTECRMRGAARARSRDGERPDRGPRILDGCGATGREAVVERMGGASALQNEARAEGTRERAGFRSLRGCRSEAPRTSYVPPRPGAPGTARAALRGTAGSTSGDPAAEESPFVELTSRRPSRSSLPTEVAASAPGSGEAGVSTEVDLSHVPKGRVVMGRGGLVELERPQPPANVPPGGVVRRCR